MPARSVVVAKTGEGLVEQHRLRLERERNRDFQLRASRHAKAPGECRGAGDEPDAFQRCRAWAFNRASRSPRS